MEKAHQRNDKRQYDRIDDQGCFLYPVETHNADAPFRFRYRL